MNTTILQIVLTINIFLLGVVVALVAQFAYAHRVDKKKTAEKELDRVELPPQIKQRIVNGAKTKFTNTLNASAHGLERELGDTSEELSGLLKRFGAEILDSEMKLFRKHLEGIRENTERAVEGASGQVASQQAALETELAKRQSEFEAQLRNLQTDLEGTLLNRNKELDHSLLKRREKLEEKLNADVAAERERLLKQIDTRLADAVASFLADTLEHNVDLGAQGEYLVQLLETHKDEFKKEVGYEDRPTT